LANGNRNAPHQQPAGEGLFFMAFTKKYKLVCMDLPCLNRPSLYHPNGEISNHFLNQKHMKKLTVKQTQSVIAGGPILQ